MSPSRFQILGESSVVWIFRQKYSKAAGVTPGPEPRSGMSLYFSANITILAPLSRFPSKTTNFNFKQFLYTE